MSPLGRTNGSILNSPDILQTASTVYMAKFSPHPRHLSVRPYFVWLPCTLANATILAPAKRVMSLKEPTLKMSKSHSDRRSRILLTDTPEDIHKKIKSALTDSNTSVSYDPVRRPGVSNLLEILSHFDGRSCQELAAEYESLSLQSLKGHLGGQISHHLQPIREKYFSLIEDKTNYLDDVAEEGARTASANAAVTMRRVREALGLW